MRKTMVIAILLSPAGYVGTVDAQVIQDCISDDIDRYKQNENQEII